MDEFPPLERHGERSLQVYNSSMHELAIAEALIEQVGTELQAPGRAGP